MHHSWQGASGSSLTSSPNGVDLDSTTQSHYSARANLLFQSEASRSWIDAHYQLHSDDGMNNTCQYDMPVSSPTGSAADSDIGQFGSSLIGHDKIVNLDLLRRFTAAPTIYGSDVDLSGSTPSLRSRGSVKTFFIRQKHSFSRLSISRELFEHLLIECKVFGRFKEFALSFGIKARENDMAPPALSIQINGIAAEGQFVSFECAYGLRYVELNNKEDEREPWSVRQMAVHQRYDQEALSCTWIMIAAPKSIEKRMDDYMVDYDPFVGNPFEFHVAIFETALANWRWYIASLTDRTTDQSERVILASVAEGKLSAVLDFEINFTDRQQLKILEDQALDGLVVLDATADTISNLRDEVEYACPTPSIQRSQIIRRLRAQLSEVQLNRKKVEALHKRIQGTASLLSDLLNYENAQIGHGNEVSLRDLAQEARAENVVMRVLTEKGTRDAAAVKVLTVITLIYLPSTVITNFFSSLFVTTQVGEGGAEKVVASRNVWLFAATAIPLTVVTLAIWYCWVRIQSGFRPQRKTDIEEQSPTPVSSPILKDNEKC